jgi:transcription initiation factor TFIIIB Brf1 subunit/transcription initiation factor TFIIB
MDFVHDHGDVTCTQCGFVYLDHSLTAGYQEERYTNDHMYSNSYRFESHWKNNKKNSLFRTSKFTDRKMTSMCTESLTTSDFYKDTQRNEVYSLLDNMKEVVPISEEIIDRAKDYYNVYRSQMVRIHKLPLVLASIVWIVMDASR